MGSPILWDGTYQGLIMIWLISWWLGGVGKSEMSKQGAKRRSKKMNDGAAPLSNHGTI